jgi:hypothetical protein
LLQEKRRLTARTTLGFFDVLGFLIGLFGSFREELRGTDADMLILF